MTASTSQLARRVIYHQMMLEMNIQMYLDLQTKDSQLQYLYHQKFLAADMASQGQEAVASPCRQAEEAVASPCRQAEEAVASQGRQEVDQAEEAVASQCRHQAEEAVASQGRQEAEEAVASPCRQEAEEAAEAVASLIRQASTAMRATPTRR